MEQLKFGLAQPLTRREDLRFPELVLAPLDFHDYARGAAVAAIRQRFTSPA